MIFSDIIKCFRWNLLRLIYVFKWLALCLSLWLSPAFPSGSVGKESAYSSGDAGLITGWGRSSGVGHDNPPQYSCLENPMDSGAWRSIDHAVTMSQTWLKWLSMHAMSFSCFMSLSVSWALVYFCVLSFFFFIVWTFDYSTSSAKLYIILFRIHYQSSLYNVSYQEFSEVIIKMKWASFKHNHFS